jgi:hypothetical protein
MQTCHVLPPVIPGVARNLAPILSSTNQGGIPRYARNDTGPGVRVSLQKVDSRFRGNDRQ